MKEGRFAMLAQADPARAKTLGRQAQAEADARWQFYEQVAGVHRVVAAAPHGGRRRAGVRRRGEGRA